LSQRNAPRSGMEAGEITDGMRRTIPWTPPAQTFFFAGGEHAACERTLTSTAVLFGPQSI
jgi:hypothetical protein